MNGCGWSGCRCAPSEVTQEWHGMMLCRRHHNAVMLSVAYLDIPPEEVRRRITQPRAKRVRGRRKHVEAE